VQPLFISKVNTVFQLGLVGTCMLHAWLGSPGEGVVWAGSVLTAGTTLWTTAAYLRAFRQGRLLAPAGPPSQQ
jgi:phosphatidylglycerophosphate synthase